MKLRQLVPLLLGFTTSLQAAIKLPHFFSDHMVLQRERAAAIWGTADAGATVKAIFKGKSAEAKADASGRWKLNIETGQADATGATLTLASGSDSLTLHDVLVGEVWFASGQSNMVFRMKQTTGAEDFIAKANFPAFRFFDGPNVTAVEPQTDIEGKWAACTPETVGEWSGVASYFAIKLHQELGVPVGVLESSWGGKPVEAFTSREALNTLPGTKALVDEVLAADKSYDDAKAQAAYNEAMEKWKTTVAEAKAKGQKTARNQLPPVQPKRPLNTERNPGVLFDAMIHPFIGYSIRGAIWYQGEGNARYGAVPYDQTLPLLITDWRKRWGNEFSFYFVQLANYQEASTEPGVPDAWPLLQDRMRHILTTTAKTGMAVINDVGDAKDIHPKDKRTPGERLARWALAKDYGRDIFFSSPLYKSSDTKSDSITVTFDYAGNGLKSRDGGPLKRFEIAGEDKKWHWAEAKITAKNSVTVSSPDVPKPLAVRYAWAANPEGANLLNSEGLPASVFRTDDWPDAEPPPPPGAERAKKLAEIRAQMEKMKGISPRSEEGKAMKAKLDEMLKAFKDSAPAPAQKQ
jgi:sialate O-acetylesterase